MKPIAEYSRELNWQLKNFLRYSPPLKHRSCIKTADSIIGQFNVAQQQRLTELQQNYLLDDWPQLCNRTEYIENLYLLDLLDQHLDSKILKGSGLDIGCRSFSHLPALSVFARHEWHGVELDAHARYWNGYTRRAYGEWMAQQRCGSHYIADSLLQVQGRFNTISWLLPFVVEAALQRWGLPARYFQPQPLLEKACSLLADDGVMIIINQGEHEADVQQVLFETVLVKVGQLGRVDSVFSPFKQPRYGWLVRR